jgi:hypothetical protein
MTNTRPTDARIPAEPATLETVHTLYWAAIAADEAYSAELSRAYSPKLAPVMRYKPQDLPAYLRALGDKASAAADAYLTACRSRTAPLA